jgi:hypothetical protein
MFPPYMCVECGYQGTPKTFTRGSLLTELMLWLLLIVPGVLYSLWRLTTRYRGCPACYGRMIPVDSPRGTMLRQQFAGAREGAGVAPSVSRYEQQEAGLLDRLMRHPRNQW